MEHRSILLQFAPGVRALGCSPVRRRRKHEKERKDTFSVDYEELLFVDCHTGGQRRGRNNGWNNQNAQQSFGDIEQ